MESQKWKSECELKWKLGLSGSLPVFGVSPVMKDYVKTSVFRDEHWDHLVMELPFGSPLHSFRKKAALCATAGNVFGGRNLACLCIPKPKHIEFFHTLLGTMQHVAHQPYVVKFTTAAQLGGD